MNEYITKEQALDAVNDSFNDAMTAKEFWDLLPQRMNAIPPADVVEIVRCKDCYKLYPDGNGGMLNYCRVHHIFVNANDFCSYGARKGDENETD